MNKAPRRPAAKTVAKAAAQAASSATAPAEAQTLVAAADVLFGTAENPLTLSDGREIVVKKGQVQHLGLLLAFFNSLVSHMSREDLVVLIQLIQEQKAKADGTWAGVDLVTIVEQVYGRAGLVTTIFQATYDVLPKIVAAMTTVKESEFVTMELPDGIALAFTIFEVNYDFFSRNLPMAIKASLGRAVQKLAASQ
jgi:hypothetical protein